MGQDDISTVLSNLHTIKEGAILAIQHQLESMVMDDSLPSGIKIELVVRGNAMQRTIEKAFWRYEKQLTADW